MLQSIARNLNTWRIVVRNRPNGVRVAYKVDHYGQLALIASEWICNGISTWVNCLKAIYLECFSNERV